MKKKIDLVLWAVIWFLPVLCYLVIFARGGSDAIPFLEYINGFAFPFVEYAINGAWSLAFGSNLALAGYISYLVSVEIAHCFFDALVFIPRFAHGLINRFTDFAERGGQK